MAQHKVSVNGDILRGEGLKMAGIVGNQVRGTGSKIGEASDDFS